MTAAVTGGTRVRLHPLRMRRDEDVWYVGRVETGEFVELPPIAIEALRLFEEGLSADEVAAELKRLHGRDINAAGFLANLVGLGFVAAADGQPLDGPAPIRPTWPWLRPAHTRWTLSPITAVIALAIPLAALITVTLRPALLPSYHDLFWNTHTSLIVLGNAAAAWTILTVHELAHLFTARAVGVPGTIRLGTRLQFLSVQTDVTGIWVAPRRVRTTVYLSGIAVNLAVAGAAVLSRAAVDPGTAADRLLAAVALISLIMVPTQFLLFMRTDLYFLMQDLTRCANLYADGGAYVRYRARRVAHTLRGDTLRGHTHRGAAPTDPSTCLRPREQRAVRAYAPLLAVGTVLCLTFAAAVTVPTGLTVLLRCVHGLADGPLSARVDAIVVSGVAITGWTLWTRAWWGRHGPKVTTWVTRHRPERR
ncbi:hypothetical protein [Cryptosporangium sp. NPDC051539]|uniref:hypothetical protein n=1 Tax=Cryptosporangium sp. NPDC051539 TaxID=3363962 RepID=UPI0037974B77